MAEGQGCLIQTDMTTEEKDKAKEIAKKHGYSFQGFVRKAILEAAEKLEKQE